MKRLKANRLSHLAYGEEFPKPKGKSIAGVHSPVAGKDEWLTPPSVLLNLGHFDLDPCAPVVRPWATASHHFTVEDDGLKRGWFGRVWCNPPYGDATGRWLSRCAEHGNAIALSFARTETETWQNHVWKRAHGILFLFGRLTFFHGDGTRAKHNSGGPSALIAYNNPTARILKECGIPGHFVSLSQP